MFLSCFTRSIASVPLIAPITVAPALVKIVFGGLAGKNAATYIKNPARVILSIINTNPGNNLGYLLPNKIRVNEDLKEVTFSFRVRKPIKKGIIYIKDGNVVIKKQFKPFLIPSEMEHVVLKDVDFKTFTELTISVEETV